MNKIFLIKTLIFIAAFAITGFFVFRQGVVIVAQRKAHVIMGEQNGEPSEIIYQASKLSHEKFVQSSGRIGHEARPFLVRLRPILTNYRLPSWIAFPDGAIETLHAGGWCEDAARMLQFILAQYDLPSRQWNMAKPDGAHSALVVDLPGGGMIFTDPFYGVIATDQNGNLTGPFAKDLRFQALSDKSDLSFYKDFEGVVMAARSEEMTIRAIVPEELPLTLGGLDGSADDVQSDSMKHRMGSYWTYMGSRYDRAWTRVLKASRPVKVTFILTDDVDDGVVTSNKPPAVSGKTLTWVLDKDEELVLTDGKARLSLLRLNSYIPIDQIVFESP